MGTFGKKSSNLAVCLVNCRKRSEGTQNGLYSAFVYEVDQSPLVWPYIPNQEDQ